jgi:DHA2 family multidrug resistance protein
MANPLLQRQMAKLTPLMQAHAGPHRAFLRVWSITQTGLDRQAQLFAYVDVFRYLALALAFCAPLAFLLKKTSGAKEGAG